MLREFWSKPKKTKPVVNNLVSLIEKAPRTSSNNTKEQISKPSYQNEKEYYSNSDLVFSCVNFIAETSSLTKLRIKTIDSKGKEKKIRDKKLQRLINVSPNDFMSWGEYFERAIQSYLLYGNTFTAFEKLKNYELWVLQPDKVEIVPNPDMFIEGYLYDRSIRYEYNELIHSKRASIFDNYYGSSVITSILKDYLEVEGYGVEDLKSFYRNGSVGYSALETEFPLSLDKINELREQFQNAYSGANRYNTIILPAGLKYRDIKISPKDALVLDSLNITDSRILRVFRLNEQVLGGSGFQFAHKIDEVTRMVFNTAILPILNKIIKDLELFFKKLTKDDNLILMPDFSNIPYISSLSQDEVMAVTKAVAGGLLTYNEGREALGKEKKDGEMLDVCIAPSYLVGSTPIILDTWDGKPIEPPKQNEQPLGSISPDGGDTNGEGGIT